MKQKDFWIKARKVLINKYAITLYVFAVLFIFIGEQSLINQISRKREIRKTRREIEQIKSETAERSSVLQPSVLPKKQEKHFSWTIYRRGSWLIIFLQVRVSPAFSRKI